MLTRQDLNLVAVGTIVLEVTTVCNLKCPTCRVTQSKQKPQFMEFSKFVQIANSIKPYIQMAKTFNISSSESLLHPKVLDMIDVIKSINPRIQFSIITNAMLLDDVKQKELLKRGVNAICVSIDGAKPETTEQIRVGSKLSTVIENAHNYILKGGMVRTIYVVRDNNLDDLLPFVDLASEIGIWFIKLTGLVTYTKEDVKHALYSWEGNPKADEIYRQASLKAKEKGILFQSRTTKLDNCSRCCLCNTMYVGINGDISPCVFYTEPTPLTLLDETVITEPIFWGNVLEENPQKIWNSTESLTFRQGIMKGENCKTCGMKYLAACGQPMKEVCN